MNALLDPAGWKKFFGGRVARNMYFWALDLYMAFGLNSGNEQAYHYGIIHSAWYLPVMAGSLVLYCTLVYANNLWLVPQYLVKRKRLGYAGLLLLLSGIVALLITLLLKAAHPHLNTEEIQHPGFVTTVLSQRWSLSAIIMETQTFFFCNLLWILVFTMAWYMNDYSRQQKALRLAEQQRTEAELAFLKNQINPHFLFNTLNNIYGLAMQKSDATPEVILKLSSLLRYLLYESNTAAISFQKEKAAIEAYVEIEALRLPDDAVIRLELHADQDYQLPSLLWLPILENAFKHGTRLIGIPVSVDFIFRIEKGMALISTSNNYLPGGAEAAQQEGGIGLANLRKRLEIVFPDRYSLRVAEDGSVFSSTLNIQLA